MEKKMSKEQAEKLADELLAQQPSRREAGLVTTLGKMFALRPLRHDSTPNPFASPASPLWGVMQRDTDTSK